MVDAHSELMTQYPWGFAGRPRTRARTRRTRGVLRQAQPRVPRHREAHRARPATTPTRRSSAPTAIRERRTTGPGHYGPFGQGRRCAADQTPAPMPSECDDGPFGHGTGGQLRYDVDVPGSGSTTLWIAVAGSENSVAEARSELAALIADPGGPARGEAGARARRSARRSKLDPARATRSCRTRSSGASRTSPTSRRSRRTSTSAGPTRARSGRPRARCRSMRWIGAGFPDYPWLFGVDGEYTAHAAVTLGQFGADQGPHAGAARDLRHPQRPLGRRRARGRRGRVGLVRQGLAPRPTPTAPSATTSTRTRSSSSRAPIALIWRWTGDNGFRDEMLDFTWRDLEYVRTKLDADGDGWPEGNGNVERPGMGEEKLDNTVYYIRGLYDFADMARSAGQTAARRRGRGARRRASPRRFEDAWWIEADQQYADSLRRPRRRQGQPEALDRRRPDGGRAVPRRRVRPGPRLRRARVGGARHAREQLLQRRAARQPRPVPHRLRRRADRCGRVRDLLAQHRHPGRRRGQLRPPRRRAAAPLHGRQRGDPVLRAGDRRHARRAAGRDAGDHAVRAAGRHPGVPGGTPPNIDRCWTCRSMFMQAWGHYGTAWAVVHQQLGVRPQLGHGWLEVVPQVPDGQPQRPGRGHPPRRRLGRRARLPRGQPLHDRHRHERGAGRRRS